MAVVVLRGGGGQSSMNVGLHNDEMWVLGPGNGGGNGNDNGHNGDTGDDAPPEDLEPGNDD